MKPTRLLTIFAVCIIYVIAGVFESFAQSTPSKLLRLAGDFDGDGFEDLFVLGSPESWMCPGNAGLECVVHNPYGWGDAFTAVVGDFDGDGKDDIFLLGSPTSYLCHASWGLWCEVHNPYAWRDAFTPVAGDFDGDGRTDIFLLGSPTSYLCHASWGLWCEVHNPYAWRDAFTPVAGDFDGDGRTDIWLWGFQAGDMSSYLCPARWGLWCETPAGMLSQNLQGGVLDSGHPAVGRVNGSGGLCTGVLIAPRAVLTAAHCSSRATPGATVIFGQSSYTGTARLHPAYNNGPVQYDIAVINLDRDVANITPMALKERRTWYSGSHATFEVGVGELCRWRPVPALRSCEYEGLGSAGTKRSYQVPYAGFPVSNPVGLLTLRGSTLSSCRGDSGGPSLDESDSCVIGIHTGGVGLYSSNNTCALESYDVVPMDHFDFIGSNIIPPAGKRIVVASESATGCRRYFYGQ